MTGGCYPYWFMSKNQFKKTPTGERYIYPPTSYMHMMPQHIYVFNSPRMKAEFYVNTPHLDLPGYYAVFESTRYDRDNALKCTAEDSY